MVHCSSLYQRTQLDRLSWTFGIIGLLPDFFFLSSFFECRFDLMEQTKVNRSHTVIFFLPGILRGISLNQLNYLFPKVTKLVTSLFIYVCLVSVVRQTDFPCLCLFWCYIPRLFPTSLGEHSDLRIKIWIDKIPAIGWIKYSGKLNHIKMTDTISHMCLCDMWLRPKTTINLQIRR